MIVEARDQTVAVLCEICRSVCQEINTEAEENLGALLQLVLFRYFVDPELLAAHGAFFAAVTQSVQPRADSAMGAQYVTGVIALRRTHSLPEMRDDGIRVDNHWRARKEGSNT